LPERVALPLDRPTVFLDRDGVINRRRLDHVRSWQEFEFLPGTLVGLAALRLLGARVIVVTNQAAVGRGLLSVTRLEGIHDEMRRAVQAAGGAIEAIYACLHRPDAGCGCRKPAAGLLLAAASDLGLSLKGSIMVGDSISDVEAARAAGCLPVLIAGDSRAVAEPVLVLRDLLDVADLVRRLRSRVPVLC
jgi:D-glycero-D-manno-heptose 1,7-bisphosphate phosphatase